MAKANLRQQLFAEAWIATKGNGTESARRAGYSGNDRSLGATAVRLLGNQRVKALIAARTERALVNVQGTVTPEQVIQELTEQLYGRKPARWMTEGKQYDSQNAAALLGKFLGLEKRGEEQRPTINLVNLFVGLPADALREATRKAINATVDAEVIPGNGHR
jgi:hypothetical protein